SGKKAVAGSNPFTDTSDSEILKAVNIGITNGTSADKFSPDALITREQAAVMLTRAYKATYWEGWTLAKDSSYTAKTLDYSGIAVFADDASISAYAKPSVYFMAKNNIINGVGNNMFAPNRANIPANAALTYGQATREAAIKIAVASFENLK
ncbi:MAG TPA: S-layer homology domain-containing protein, partial [Candidatus Diapherotrites archaeon]|nr:S-layer homology domain-containing protein [Candidatus Diapherotrites archaeon]